MQLGDLIGDAVEWSFPISHAVHDTSKGPHVTFGTDLWRKNRKTNRKCFHHSAAIRNDCLECLIDLSKSTFERAFPAWDEVSLMASGGI